MLSTSTLTLETSGNFTRLITPERSMKENFSTVLAGSETCWLVVVITDLAVLITKDHTTKYSLYSSLIMAITTAILSLTFPVQPRLVVARTCEAVEFDLQLLCQAGDRVSAFMCGLLAVTHKASIYLLDIKTWRTYTIAIDPKFDAWHLFTSSFDKARLADAIPMIE
ncbi:hypothetical protein LEN26_013178 [Aphanomyces euteiches]|nr:hypothetical protein LEN26_013178 [Aphanomyces euteiches]KAH9195816.1 hypothetical protein AeNC1_002205 [Aphanomyces euteiches]